MRRFPSISTIWRVLRRRGFVTPQPAQERTLEDGRPIYSRRLSPDTVYKRFFRPVKEPNTRVLQYLVSVDLDKAAQLATGAKVRFVAAPDAAILLESLAAILEAAGGAARPPAPAATAGG